MDTGVDQNDTNESRVKETQTGSREFRGAVEHGDPNAARRVPAPDGVPAKFWDDIEGKLRQDELIKSYQELEKKIGSGRSDEDADEDGEDRQDDQDERQDGQEGSDEDREEDQDERQDGDEGEDDEEDGEGDDDAPQATFEKASAEAAQVYAEKGELDAEARKPLKALGISDEQIDLYLNGVKATEAALKSAAVKAAGSEDAMQAAVQWAAENWSEKKINAFNAQTGDVETVGTAYAGLMAEFREANPGEGNLQNINSGVSRGDVYESMEDYREDLQKADEAGNRNARRKAVEKFRRSRQAGTIKSERRQPFGG